MSSELSRRELIASGAAGTAGALGLSACSTNAAQQPGAMAAALPATGQPPAGQEAAAGVPLYKRFKPFLAQRFLEDRDRPTPGTGVLEEHLLCAWVTKQLITQFDPSLNYTAPPEVNPVAMAYFQEYEDRLQRLIDTAEALKSETNIAWNPIRASDIIILPPKPPQPPPPGGDEVLTIRPGPLIRG